MTTPPPTKAHLPPPSEREFEEAADVVVAGDLERLSELLDADPTLITARSGRRHGATLLHYVGANGVEGFRQKTPANAPAVLDALLAAGADVDATAGIYGRDTTLLLVATSIHPVRVGLQIPLLERLLAAGASIDGPNGTVSTVNACLANGRGDAALFLADRGAALDLEGAAGVGRVDLVEQWFATSSAAKRQAAFDWACEYGRDPVVELLLGLGVDVAGIGSSGLSGLHWAAVGGQLSTIDLLLRAGAPLELDNIYGGTPLGQAIWSATNQPEIDYAPTIRRLIDAGANLDAARTLRRAVAGFFEEQDGAGPEQPSGATPTGGTEREATPGPVGSHLVPMLCVEDVDAAVAWYSTLGFTLRARHPDSGPMDWAAMSFGATDIMLQPLGRRPSQQVALWFTTTDVSYLYRRITTGNQAPIEIIEEVYEPFYGGRQFSIRDPDGLELVFRSE